jgi:3-oxoacyl-[acyl-carrier protein] reductase
MDPTVDGRFAGKVALITGGSRGIGAAISARFARDGAKVVVNYRANAEAADRVVGQISALGGEAFAVKADVGQVEAAQSLVAAAVERFGRLDILVNNAATFRGGPVDAIVEADFDKMFAANVKSVLFLSQAAVRVFDGRGGVIVNLSSINTRAPSPRGALYSATKAAVEALTISLAREWAPRGVRVNAVAPGQTDTDMLRAANTPESIQASISRIALGRLGRPDEIADVVAFLASEEARWITGETLHVSGGQRL